MSISGDNNRDNMTIIDNDMDISNASRGVWLVKVPKYIAKKWEKAPSEMNIGHLRINQMPKQKTSVSLLLTPSVMALDTDEIPSEYVVNTTEMANQTVGVFAQVDPSEMATDSGTSKGNPTVMSESDGGQLSMEGQVVQKLVFRPVSIEAYMKMKMDTIRKAAEPQIRVQAIDKPVQNYKPVKDHAHNYRERKKARGDKNAVMDKLFQAFEKHQYYTVKDLVKITNQPVGHLKEILEDICDYNNKSPHKNMWELKKEYRHYETKDKTKEIDKPKEDQGDRDNGTSNGD